MKPSINLFEGDANGLAVSPMAQLIDAQLRDLTGDDPAISAQLIATFIETHEMTIDALKHAVNAGACSDVAVYAHKLAGSMRLLGCTDLLGQLTALEAAARSSNVQGIKQTMPPMLEELHALDRVLTALRARGA